SSCCRTPGSHRCLFSRRSLRIFPELHSRLFVFSMFHQILFQALFAELLYFTTEPFGRSSATDARARFPFSSSPESTMPSESSPRNFTGFKFVTQITFLPMRFSGL